MRFHLFHLAVAGFCCISSLQAREVVREVRIANPTGQPREACPVVLDLKTYAKGLDVRSATVLCDGSETASQLDDLDGDFRADELAFVAYVPAQGSVTCRVTLSDQESPRTYTARTRAYIKLHDQKGKHPEVNSITYPGNADLLDMYNSLYGHGAVFESELAAFRIYMDNRQSIDIYGKTHPRLEMDHTGFYTTKEQLAQGYGCDILWAGQSVGAGSFRGYQNEKPCYIDTVAWRRQTVLASGPVRAIVEVADGQWTYNGHPLQMRQRYTLYAGHRDVEVSVDISGSLPGDTFCTGIQKLESEPSGFMQEDGLCGSWGCNVPEKSEPDHREWVGLGLYAASGNRIGMEEDDFNYLTLLRPDKDRQIRYRLTVCARREKDGFKTAQEWFDYLRQWKAEADSPCTVTVR